MTVKQTQDTVIRKMEQALESLNEVKVFAESTCDYYLKLSQEKGDTSLFQVARRFDIVRHDITKTINRMKQHINAYKKLMEANNE